VRLGEIGRPNPPERAIIAAFQRPGKNSCHDQRLNSLHA